MENRPQGREKNVTGAGKSIQKHGSGLNTGSVGSRPASSSGSRPVSRPVSSSGSRPASSSSGSRPVVSTTASQRVNFPVAGVSTGTGTSSGGQKKRSPLLAIIIAAVVLLGGGGAGLSGLFGGGGGGQPSGGNPQPQVTASSYTQPTAASSGTSAVSTPIYSLASLFGGNVGSSIGSVSSGWTGTPNTSRLNTSVDAAARPKRTAILGGGQDTVTIMVYMCGSDLESKSGMGTADIAEMTAAALSDKVNLLVYTGGASTWKNNVISSSVNQIYKVEQGGLRCLVKDDGAAAMTDPKTLTRFIEYCTENYPANRCELIFWDHGGGSISGYGYDEKKPNAGSMTLKSIDEALTAAGTTFDFIGFDACLMGTLENAITLAPHADYLIASEETEPGIGWYYTNWLNALSQNTSMSTLDIGKNIVDDFVATCDKKCSGQKTTLSLVDLAELENTVPDSFRSFALSLSGLLQDNEYKTVSDARVNSREFAVSSKVDQVDLVNLAQNIGTEDSLALADTLLSAVKYNRTSNSITDAYGLSIYFPYQKLSRVDNAVNAYSGLELDSEYSRCIQQFASLEASGQAVSGGSASPVSSLLGGGASGGSSAGLDIAGLLSSFLGGDTLGVAGLGSGNTGFLGRGLDADDTAAFLAEHRFDASALVWSQKDGRTVMPLSEKQWSLVQDLALSVYYDDGEGFIDLGLDNVFEFTSEGALVGEYDGTWLAINGQPVPYYYEDTVNFEGGYAIMGSVPVLLNGSRAELVLVFDNAQPYGYIAGMRSVYVDEETETVAKSLGVPEPGDVIEFICDYYAYDGRYLNSYLIGDAWVYDGTEEISNVYIDADAACATYLFTDIYNQNYWTPLIP